MARNASMASLLERLASCVDEAMDDSERADWLDIVPALTEIKSDFRALLSETEGEA